MESTDYRNGAESEMLISAEMVEEEEEGDGYEENDHDNEQEAPTSSGYGDTGYPGSFTAQMLEITSMSPHDDHGNEEINRTYHHHYGHNTKMAHYNSFKHDIPRTSFSTKGWQFKTIDPFGTTSATITPVAPQRYGYSNSMAMARHYHHGDDHNIAIEMGPQTHHKLTSNCPVIEDFLTGGSAMMSFGEVQYTTSEELIYNFEQRRTTPLYQSSCTNTNTQQSCMIPSASFHSPIVPYIASITSQQLDNHGGPDFIHDQSQNPFHGNMRKSLRFPLDAIQNGFQEAMFVNHPLNLPQNTTGLLHSNNENVNVREEEGNDSLKDQVLHSSPSDTMGRDGNSNLGIQAHNTFRLRDYSSQPSSMTSLMVRAATEDCMHNDASFHSLKNPLMRGNMEDYSSQMVNSDAYSFLRHEDRKHENVGHLSTDYTMESSTENVNNGTAMMMEQFTECALQLAQPSCSIPMMSNYNNDYKQVAQQSHVKPTGSPGADGGMQPWVKGSPLATNPHKFKTSGSPSDFQNSVTLLISSAASKPCGHTGIVTADNPSRNNPSANNPPLKKKASTKAQSEKHVPCTAITNSFGQRTSQYRGVTRHRWTGRYEAHLWDNSCITAGQTRKGRQVYLGGYDMEDKAARAYDLAALKFWGHSSHINFPLSTYENELETMKNMTRVEFVASLRRKSTGFSRGASAYRGVTRHHQQGRWQARIGRVTGNKDLYLGTYGTQEEAAEAYDIAAIKFRGPNTVTNFDVSKYDVKSICCSSSVPGELVHRKVWKKQNQIKAGKAINEEYAPDWNVDDDKPCLDRASVMRQNKEEFPEAAKDSMASSLQLVSTFGNLTSGSEVINDSSVVKLENIINTEGTVSSPGSPAAKCTCEGSISQCSSDEAPRPPKKTKLISMLGHQSMSISQNALEELSSNTLDEFSEGTISKDNEAHTHNDDDDGSRQNNVRVIHESNGPLVCMMPIIDESVMNDHDHGDVIHLQRPMEVPEAHGSSSTLGADVDESTSLQMNEQKPKEWSGENSVKHTLTVASKEEEIGSPAACEEESRDTLASKKEEIESPAACEEESRDTHNDTRESRFSSAGDEELDDDGGGSGDVMIDT